MTLSHLQSAAPDELSRRGLLHTPREIAQQPRTWLDTFSRVCALEPQLVSALEGVGRARTAGTAGPSVLLLGAGTSDFVGRSCAHQLRRLWSTSVEALPTTDFVTHEASLLLPGRPYLSISFSRSGSSPESVLALEHLLEREPHSPQLIVTCDARGAMASRLARHPRALLLLLDDAVNDRGLAMTSSYSNLLLSGLALSRIGALERFGRVVEQLASAWEHLLPHADALAERLANQSFSRVQYLGSGALNGVARESALKLVELTAGRVNSAAESFLGMRHGPLSALDERALVVALVSGDARVRRYELDLLREIRHKALAREVIVLATRPEPELVETATQVLSLELEPPVSDDELAPVMVLFGQLLGLYGSLAHGLRPDAPSPDGVIHRVVSGIELHA